LASDDTTDDANLKWFGTANLTSSKTGLFGLAKAIELTLTLSIHDPEIHAAKHAVVVDVAPVFVVKDANCSQRPFPPPARRRLARAPTYFLLSSEPPPRVEPSERLNQKDTCNEKELKTCSSFHPDRTPGRHRHHCHSRGDAATRAHKAKQSAQFTKCLSTPGLIVYENESTSPYRRPAVASCATLRQPRSATRLTG